MKPSSGTMVSFPRSRAGRLLPYALVSFFIAITFLWPLFLDGYDYSYNGATEIMMFSSLKEVFNNALRSGGFPLWNQWVGSGKPFLPFGTSMLHLFTPLELLFGDSLVLSKLEIVVDLAIACFFFLLLSRYLHFPVWMGCVAFAVYFHEGNYPLLVSYGSMTRALFTAAPFMLALLMLYFTRRDRMLIAWYLVLALLFTLGIKPEMFFMFLLFVSLAVILEHGRAKMASVSPRPTVRETLKDLFFFAGLPLGFFSWQLPLIRSLVVSCHARFAGSRETIHGVLTNFLLQFSYSRSLRTFLIVGLAVIAGQGIAYAAARTSRHGMRRLLGWVLVLRIPLLALLLLSIPAGVFRNYLVPLASADLLNHQNASVDFSRFPRYLFTMVLIVALWRQYARREFDPDRSITVFLHTGFRHLWKWPVLAAAVQSAMFETIPLTRYEEIPFLFRACMLFLVFLGGLHDETSRDKATESGYDIRRLSDYLVALFALGWIIRDFLVFPLYDLLNFVWVNPRDLFWTSGITALLLLLGLHSFFTHPFMKRTPCSTYTFPPIRNNVRGAILGLLILSTLQFVLFAATRFYTAPGRTVLATWHRYTPEQLASRQAHEQEYRDVYTFAQARDGGFVRMNSEGYFPLILAGYGAKMGIPDAWSYDFTGDDYRSLLEDTYGAPKVAVRSMPRLMYYSALAPAVVRHRFGITLQEASKAYDADVTMQHGNSIDTFYMEVMRSGVLWSGEPAAPSVLVPKRSFRRIGIVQDAGTDTERLLTSKSRDDLITVYNRMMFSDDEMRAAGYHVTAEQFGDNDVHLAVTARQKGYLVLFDAWHPDWQATNNGTKQRIVKAFRSFRAVPLVAGENDVRFAFRPQFMLAALLLTFAAALYAIIFGWQTIRHNFFSSHSISEN